MSDTHYYNTYAPAQVITKNLGLTDEYRRACIEEVLQLGDSINRESNVKADMSQWRIWQQSDVFNELLSKIESVGRLFIEPTSGDPQNQAVIFNAWSAVYKKGDYTISHNHSLSALSFCYYLQADRQDSPLHFETLDNFYVRPHSDLLVIFPSTLNHWVPEQTSDNLRVVIAGNFAYQ